MAAFAGGVAVKVGVDVGVSVGVTVGVVVGAGVDVLDGVGVETGTGDVQANRKNEEAIKDFNSQIFFISIPET